MSDYNTSTKAYQEAAKGVHVVATDIRDEYWFKLGFYSRQKMHNAAIAKYQQHYEKREVDRLYLMKENDDLKIKNDLLDAKNNVLLASLHLCVSSFSSDDNYKLELAIKKANEILIKYGE